MSCDDEIALGASDAFASQPLHLSAPCPLRPSGAQPAVRADESIRLPESLTPLALWIRQELRAELRPIHAAVAELITQADGLAGTPLRAAATHRVWEDSAQMPAASFPDQKSAANIIDCKTGSCVLATQHSNNVSLHLGTTCELLPQSSVARRTSELEEIDAQEEKDARAVSEMAEPYLTAYKNGKDEAPVLCGCAARIVNHTYFEVAIAMAILTNAIFIGAEVQHTSTHLGLESPVAFIVLGYLYTAIFLAELLARMLANGVRYLLCGGHCAWNWLDCFIVASSIMEVIVGDAVGDIAHSSTARLLRILKMTRILRILRLPQIIRYITKLQQLIHAIVVTFKSLVWAMILLALIIYVHAILITHAVADHRAGGVAVAEHVDAFWGSLWLSALTLFGSICGGTSWMDASLALRSISVSLELVFLVYISFTYFAVLNVMTGVFCSSAIESARNDPDIIAQSLTHSKEKVLKQMEQLFRAVDTDGSGWLTVKELEVHIEDVTVQAHFAALGVDPLDVWTLFRLLDGDDDHLISLEEFFMGCVKINGEATAMDMAKLSEETRFIITKLGHIQCMLESGHGGGPTTPPHARS